MKPPPRKPRDLSFTVHCQKCGQGRIIADGYNAIGITVAKMIQCLKVLGWQYAPKIICAGCVCPLDYLEKMEAHKLLDFKDPIQYRLNVFRAAMKKKYLGKDSAIDNWFKSIQQYHK